MDVCNYFLLILSDYIHNKEPTSDKADIDPIALVELARVHQLAAIVYEYITRKGNLENGLKNALFNSVINTVAIQSNQDRCLSEIKSYLTDRNVQYCIVKGKTVATYYNKPYHRTMGDIDLVVNTNDRELIGEHLLSIGFENRSKNINHEWVYIRGNIEIELHDRLVYPEVFNKKCEEEFFNGIWQHVVNNDLESDFHFVYLLYHLKKHLTANGAGFRQFLDLCLMWKKCKSLDKDRIIFYLQKTEMLSFAKVVFSLCAYWFNDDALYFFDGKTPVSKETMDELTATICHNGVFGFHNPKNKDNVSVNNMRYRSNRFISIIRIIKEQCFPSYQNMIAIPKYQFLLHRKYLLPVAWVYRLLVNLTKERGKVFLKKKLNFVSKEKQIEREIELKKWHIIDD